MQTAAPNLSVQLTLDARLIETQCKTFKNGLQEGVQLILLYETNRQVSKSLFRVLFSETPLLEQVRKDVMDSILVKHRDPFYNTLTHIAKKKPSYGENVYHFRYQSGKKFSISMRFETHQPDIPTLLNTIYHITEVRF